MALSPLHSLRLSALLLAAVPWTALRAQASSYTVSHRFTLGGDGGWDYLAFDTTGHRLFITRGTHVIVVDPDKGTQIGDIPNTPHAHGVALAPEFGRGFVTDAGDTAVTIFDLKTLAVLGKVKVDVDDDAILYEPATRRVVTMNGDANTATVLDPAAGKVVTTIKLPGGPEFAVSDFHGTVFANLEDKSAVVQIDVAEGKVVRQWPLAPCEKPSGLGIDRVHHRLFSGCHNNVMAISDYDAGKVIATVPIGPGVDANLFDPGTQLAFSSNGGDGTLTVVRETSPSAFSVAANVSTQRGARTMALDPASHRIYLVTADFGPPPPEGGRPKPLPGTFVLLVASPTK